MGEKLQCEFIFTGWKPFIRTTNLIMFKLTGNPIKFWFYCQINNYWMIKNNLFTFWIIIWEILVGGIIIFGLSIPKTHHSGTIIKKVFFRYYFWFYFSVYEVKSIWIFVNLYTTILKIVCTVTYSGILNLHESNDSLYCRSR